MEAPKEVYPDGAPPVCRSERQLHSLTDSANAAFSQTFRAYCGDHWFQVVTWFSSAFTLYLTSAYLLVLCRSRSRQRSGAPWTWQCNFSSCTWQSLSSRLGSSSSEGAVDFFHKLQQRFCSRIQSRPSLQSRMVLVARSLPWILCLEADACYTLSIHMFIDLIMKTWSLFF